MRKSLQLGAYDAMLNTDWCNARNNAELTLTLRLGFRQINPAGGAATGTYHDYGRVGEPTRKIVRWTPATWAAWKINFCRSAEAFWHGKFWLMNNSGKLAIRGGQTIYVPNVWCRADIVGGDAGAGAHHHVIDVVRLDPSETFFGSHSNLYDSRDTSSVMKGKDSAGRPIMQRAHVHEIGHLLGLPHVDVGKPHCPPADTNAPMCYGVTDIDQNSVMGQGMRLDWQHARPWATAFNRFLRGEPNSAVYRPPFAAIRGTQVSMRRLFPRTAAEFERHAVVTSFARR